MKSVLPPELESKRVTIARRHNRLVIALLVATFVALFTTVLLLTKLAPNPGLHKLPLLVSGIILIGILEIYGIRRIISQDAELCRQLGFICPHCHKPLYDPRGLISVTGRCPKCRASII